MVTLVVALIYVIRVQLLAGFYIVTYGLGIYLLNLLIGFLSPQVDPEQEGPTLPTKTSDEFRPFVRRLPEFKFWYALPLARICCRNQARAPTVRKHLWHVCKHAPRGPLCLLGIAIPSLC